MIFVTIGSAFPFDRLIRAMDNWAAETGRGAECFAQIGKGSYRPSHMDWCESLPEAEFAAAVQRASLIVSHAGMGSVITAMRFATPIVILPRRFDTGEHTTDHQMATARWLEGKEGVFVAWEEGKLDVGIAEAEKWNGDGATLPAYAPETLTGRLRAQFRAWLDG